MTPAEIDALIAELRATHCSNDGLHDAAASALREQREQIARLDDKIRQLRIIANVNGDWNLKYSDAVNRAERAEAERDALREDAERWNCFVELWHASTEMKVAQGEDGGWSITIIEPVEALPSPGHWAGDTPDAAIDAAKGKP